MYDKIIDALENVVDDMDILNAWNEYCQDNNYYEQEIFEMSDINDYINDYIGDVKFSDGLERLGDDFSLNDDYFCDDIYGIKSFCDIYEIIDLGALAEYMIDNNESFGIFEIQDILESYEMADEPDDIDSDFGYDPYAGAYTYDC